jgi:hypothetical protein
MTAKRPSGPKHSGCLWYALRSEGSFMFALLTSRQTDQPRDDPARVQPSRVGKGKRRKFTDTMQESFEPRRVGKFWG